METCTFPSNLFLKEYQFGVFLQVGGDSSELWMEMAHEWAQWSGEGWLTGNGGGAYEKWNFGFLSLGSLQRFQTEGS